MMKAKYIILTVLVFLSLDVFCQSQSIDSVNISRAESLINRNFRKLQSKDYLLYGIEDNYVLIKRLKNKFVLYYVDEKNGIEDSTEYKISDSTIAKAFELSSYRQCFFYSKGTRENSSYPKLLYVRLNVDGERKCEISMPLYLAHGANKEVGPFPIKEGLNTFLYNLIAERWTR